ELLGRLEALLAAQRGTPSGAPLGEPQRARPGEQPPPGVRVRGEGSLALAYTRFLKATERAVRDVVAELRKLPGVLRREFSSLRDPRRRGALLEGLLRLGAAAALALAFFFLVRWGVGRWRSRLARVEAPGPAARLGRALVGRIFGVLPAAALFVAGSLAVGLLGLGLLPAGLLMTALWAYLLYRVLLALAGAALSPEDAAGRLLPLGDASAAYLAVWARRFAGFGVWGYYLVEALDLVSLPSPLLEPLRALYRAGLLALVLVLIFQQREPVRARLALPVSPRAGRIRQSLVVGWNLAAARWHLLAVPYLGALFVVWAMEVPGGVRFLLAATAWTALIVALALAAVRATDALIGRLFRVSDRLRERFPGLEVRANRYFSVIYWVACWAIYAMAAVFVLQAWSVDALDLLLSDVGLSLVGRGFALALIVGLAAAAFEASRQAVDYFLTGRRDREGRPVGPSRKERTLIPLVATAVRWVVVGVAAIMVLEQLGVRTTPILAGVGILGLAVGFGAQSLVKDIITGMFIVLEDSISVGDVVVLKGTGGLVEGVNLRTVRLRDLAGNVHVIPNSSIDMVTNMTKEYSRYVLDIGVAYREDVDEVTEVIREVGASLQADPTYGPDMLAPIEILGLDKFADSAVIIKARLTTKPIKQWGTMREFNRRLKKAFDARGIEIPFPHQTLYWGEPKEGMAPPLVVMQANAAGAKGD
ncbi:MAG: mechanosensitive ion channel family protein, partial [Nitrospinota bacterium]